MLVSMGVPLYMCRATHEDVMNGEDVTNLSKEFTLNVVVVHLWSTLCENTSPGHIISHKVDQRWSTTFKYI